MVCRKFYDIVGNKTLRTDFWGIDDKTILWRETHADGGKRRVPIGNLEAIEPTESNMRKGLCHAIGAPNGIRKVFQLICQSIIDSTTAYDEMTNLHQTLTFRRYLRQFITNTYRYLK